MSLRSGPRDGGVASFTETTAESTDRSTRRVIPSFFSQAAIFVGALLVFALLPTQNFNYADDSLSWAYQLTQSDIENPIPINSQHLYLDAMRWLYRLLHHVGATISPVTLLALYSAVWGAIGLAFLYRFLVRAGFGNLAVWGTLLCAFSVDYWSYSIVGDVYIPAISLMIIGLYFVYCGLTSETARNAWRYAIGATIAFLLMLAHHQAHVMLVFGLVPAAFLMQKSVVRKWRVLFGVGVPAVVCALAFLLYTVVYFAMPVKDQNGLIRFGMGYVASFQDRPDQRHLSLGALINFVTGGETRALVSTNLMFRSAEVAQAIQSRYPYRAVYPFPYLVRDIPIPVAGFLGLCALIATLLALYLFARGLWAGLKERGLVLLVFIPMIPQVLFFAWWESISDEFAIWTLPLLAIIVARGAAEMTHPLRWMRTIVASLLLSTFLGSILLYWNPRNDIDWVNDQYVKSLGNNDFLIGFEDIQSANRIKLEAEKLGFKYFNIRETQATDPTIETEAALNAAVKKGERIHVSPRFTYPPKSALAFIATFNPNFDSERAVLLAKLKAIPRVDWLKPAVLEEQYFPLDAGTPSPR